MHQTVYEKIPATHWDVFEELYGDNSGSTFLVASPMKSLAEVDDGMASDKKLPTMISAEQLQKMHDLFSATVESVESNLYIINPKMSYAAAAWTKASPTFWGQ
jgi:hypothetical protein